MGDAVVLLLLGGAVLLAVVVKGFSFLQRKLSPVIDVWEGDIIAAIVRFEQHPRAPGAITPQSADVVIRRRADGLEHTSFIGGAESLPESVLEQIFSTSVPANGLRPNLALPDTDTFESALPTRHSGYRFDLSRPIAVQVEENERGSIQWSQLR